MPTIQIKGDDLYIKTPLYQYAIGLFSHCRIVHICNHRKIVEIKNKKWWRWESPIRINFSKIDYIDLTYPRLPEHDKDNPDNIYDLFLITKDPFSRIFLFRFSSIISTVQETAINCVGLITKYTSIRFGPKLKEMPLSDFKDKYICTACGHRLHPDSEFILCSYCGGKEIRIEGIDENNIEIAIWKDIKEREAKAEVKERGINIWSCFFVIALGVGFVIYIYITSIQTASNNESINDISNSSRSINKNVPKPQAYDHFIAGYNFYKQGNYNNALAEYNKAIEDDPNNNDIYYYRGTTFLKTGENDKALSDFKKSIELDPHHFESYRNLDWVFAKQGKWDAIISYWSEFIQLEPEHAQAYLERGGAYYHKGNWDAALKDAKKSCDFGNSEGCMRYKQLKAKMGN